MTPAPHHITQLLKEWGNGDQAALDRLMPLVYAELQRMARRHMDQQRPGHTLQTTALIHEAYMRLAGDSAKRWENRAHFFGVAAKAMRCVLVDHARARRSAKRGGAVRPVTLDEGIHTSGERMAGLIALDDALNDLAKLHPTLPLRPTVKHRSRKEKPDEATENDARRNGRSKIGRY